MNFKDLLHRAKCGDHAAEEQLLERYSPLLLRESVVNGVFDEDLYQELCVTLLRCIHEFRIN